MVGGSPGRSFRYISRSASSFVLTLSVSRVFRKEGLTFRLSIKSTSKFFTFFLVSVSRSSFVISLFIGIKVSFVFGSIISDDVALPIISSSSTGISLMLADSIFLISALLIFLCFLIRTSSVLVLMISWRAFWPTRRARGVSL